MSERLEFIKACLGRIDHIVVVCDRFGISEKTGQKWLRRFKEGGLDALEDRSHAPKNHKCRITPEVRERIVALKKKYPLYGPETLRDWLNINEPREEGLRWPASSSIGELLKREGLVRKKRRRHSEIEPSDLEKRRTLAQAPNEVWTADFKGEFRLNRGRGDYCFPLTVLDLNTHYLLRCAALKSVAVKPVRRVFIELFRECGLPRVIRTDNGVPFAQPNSLGRLGELSYWWVRLGIRPEHIRPGKPQENGAHERFHRTLKAAATKPSESTINTQQATFDHFCAEYNTERPHRSLPGRRPPSHHYEKSSRLYPERLPALIYPESTEVRTVNSSGHFKWRSQQYFLTTHLAGEYIGISGGDSDILTISYGSLELGLIDPESKRFVARLRWSG